MCRRTLDGPILLGPTMPGEAATGLACRPQRYPIEPVAQQLGFAERRCLPGQDKEDGLEGILGVMTVSQKLAADTQDHGPVASHQGCKSRIAPRVTPGAIPLQQLAVGKSGNRAAVEE
jgi:hypothetical protein